jgi:2'-5' RNA ligase
MKTREQIVTYWLCPAQPARTQLSAIIRDLAARFDAPIFEPHVTLFVANANGENPESVLSALITRGEYRLGIRGVDYSDEFTKTLFVQFDPNSEVTRLSEDLKRGSASPADYKLNPHLSLLYQKMDREMKRQLADNITLPFTDVTFDRVKAVLSPAKIDSHQDVEAWEVVAEKRLRE